MEYRALGLRIHRALELRIYIVWDTEYTLFGTRNSGVLLLEYTFFGLRIHGGLGLSIPGYGTSNTIAWDFGYKGLWY